MKKENFYIGDIPAVLYGEKAEKVFLFVHGLGGNKEEAEAFANLAVLKGWQVLGIDLPEHGERKEKDNAKLLPWVVVPELLTVFEMIQKNWNKFGVRATSIGAWFSLLAFSGKDIEKCLLVSPVVDMENMILNMMAGAGVSEERLMKEKEIETDFGQTLSWRYLCYVRENPVSAICSDTSILYGENDNLVPIMVIEKFAEKNGCLLEVMENGEHWFHTEEQVRFMKEWEKEILGRCPIAENL